MTPAWLIITVKGSAERAASQLLSGCAVGWQQRSGRAAESSPHLLSLLLSVDQVADSKRHFIMGCCHQEIGWSCWPFQSLTFPWGLCSCRCQGRLEFGMELSAGDRDRVGSTRSLGIFSSCITTHPWSRALPWRTPKPFLAQGTSTGDIFPPTFPYISFFHELTQFF